MVSNELQVAGGERGRTSRVFTVRIWSEIVGDVIEHRGQVRDVTTGAHRGFRSWSDLTSFLTEQLAEPMKES
jgi:hypothetical protein